MNKQELNKLISSIIISILIILLINKFVNFLYKKNNFNTVIRGYTVEISDSVKSDSLKNDNNLKKINNFNAINITSSNANNSINSNLVNLNNPNSNNVTNITLSKEEIEKLISDASIDNLRLENGKKLSKRCISCHTFEKDGINKIGPNLFGIVDKKKASNVNYSYSASLNALEGNWTVDNLFYFLKNPKQFASNTKMIFPGFIKTEEIIDVIIFLKSNK
ncbi:MAG: c-type cytochrome [Rickettsiales bacterium]